MSRSIFPLTAQDGASPVQQLPLYRDVAVDLQTGIPCYVAGEPLIVEGQDAVLSWACRTLHTVRYRHVHLSWDIGCELEALVGHTYREDSKKLEAERYVREALMVSPYILSVECSAQSLEGTKLVLDAHIQSIYGEGSIHV